MTGPTPSEHAGTVELPLDMVNSITPLIGSSVPSIRAFGNQSYQVSIRCIRRYSSLLDAMEARAMFIAGLPREGQLELLQYSLGVTLTLVGDAWRAPNPTPVLAGRSLQLSFAFLVKTLAAARTGTPFDPPADPPPSYPPPATVSFLRAENKTIITNENGTPILTQVP